MKTFLISPSINGYYITDNGALYLDWRWLRHLFLDVDEEYFQKQNTLAKKYQDDIDNFEAFKSHVKQVENSDIFIWLGTGSICIAMTNIHKDDYKNHREELIPLVRVLEYEYEELDKYNNGYELRLVEVPDDAPVFITQDSEYFTEYLATKTPFYPKPDDTLDRLKFVINQFVNEVWNHETGDFKFKGVQFALDEHYGMARYKDQFVFLQKVTFYGKSPTFEILELKGQDISAFVPRFANFALPKEQMEEFVGLYMNLINDR